jgi:DNA-directed RNA polymerase specialized sigma24 family protein
MNSNVTSAIAALQGQALNEYRVVDGEVLEEALDDLVRNPSRTGDTKHLIGSAIARARTKVFRRHRLAPIVGRIDEQPEPEEDSGFVITPRTTDEPAHDLIEARDAVARSDLPARDRNYLHLISNGFDARDLADLERAPLGTIRVRVTRAQARAREMWAAA